MTLDLNKIPFVHKMLVCSLCSSYKLSSFRFSCITEAHRSWLKQSLLERTIFLGAMANNGKADDKQSPAAHIWVRAETKEHEARAPLTPQACKDLLNSGLKVSVERSQERIFKDQEYEEVGCSLVSSGSWKEAPKDAFIVGIKELPLDSFPLVHRHIYLAHVYKNQEGWKELLARFKAGGGALLDVEYMCFKDGRQAVAEFSPVAGAVGAALGLELWTYKSLHKMGKFTIPLYYKSEDDFVAHLKSCLEKVWLNDGKLLGRPKILVIGARGLCGKGATSMLCDKIGLPHAQVVQWGSKETEKGGPFSEILDFDIFVNCISLHTDAPPKPFLQESMLKSSGRNLSVVVDVSCDMSHPHNPLPFVDDTTTFHDPVRTLDLGEGEKPLDIIAIDHLPSMLPREASIAHSGKLVKQIVDLREMEKSEVWMSALGTFKEKSALV